MADGEPQCPRKHREEDCDWCVEKWKEIDGESVCPRCCVTEIPEGSDELCPPCRKEEDEVPTFPTSANVPDVPRNGFKATDINGAEWVYYDVAEWKRV
jgi:hypothetical protein